MSNIAQVEKITKITKTIKNRKTFIIDNNEITSAGVMFFVQDPNENKKLFLFINSRNLYEDLGGKADLNDLDIYQTASREVNEETNNIIKGEKLYELLKKTEYIINPKSKYMLFFVKLNKYIEPEKFGTREIHDNFERTVEYLTIHDIKSQTTPLNFRLRFKEFYTKITNINNN